MPGTPMTSLRKAEFSALYPVFSLYCSSWPTVSNIVLFVPNAGRQFSVLVFSTWLALRVLVRASPPTLPPKLGGDNWPK